MADLHPAIHLEEAFERIEATILPCIALLLESLIDSTMGGGEVDPKVLAAELRMLASELEELTQAVERTAPPLIEHDRARLAVG